MEEQSVKNTNKSKSVKSLKSFRSNKSYKSEESDENDCDVESVGLDIKKGDRRSFKTHKITTRSAGPRKK